MAHPSTKIMLNGFWMGKRIEYMSHVSARKVASSKGTEKGGGEKKTVLINNVYLAS